MTVIRDEKTATFLLIKPRLPSISVCSGFPKRIVVHVRERRIVDHLRSVVGRFLKGIVTVPSVAVSAANRYSLDRTVYEFVEILKLDLNIFPDILWFVEAAPFSLGETDLVRIRRWSFGLLTKSLVCQFLESRNFVYIIFVTQHFQIFDTSTMSGIINVIVS